MAGLGTLGRVTCVQPLFLRRGVGGHGDCLSVGGRNKLHQVCVTCIRPVGMMCDSEFTELVMK